MKVIHTIKDLQAELTALRAQGKKVGLVPTMGALHAGHASLVKRSVSENATAVSLECSCVATNNRGCARCGT